MKKRLFAALAAVCMMAGTSAFAQQAEAPRTKAKQRPTPEQMAQRMTDRMAEKYELTDAQKQQVYDLSLQQVQSMQEHRRQMVAERKASDEKMKGILTDEQYKQWKDDQAKMMRSAKHDRDAKHYGKPRGGKKAPVAENEQ